MFGRKKSDFEKLAEREEERAKGPQFDDEASSVTNSIREKGVRETFESILIAIALALLFRFFLGEAYIIPTGSMANALQGRHYDFACEQCNYQYRVGASIENPGSSTSGQVIQTVCPMCKFITNLKPTQRRDHRSYVGDRILVNKFIYDYQAPQRWDVVVFKNPYNGKQNYIKRCVGIAGELLLIENGDIFSIDPETRSFEDRQIQAKDPRKLRAMFQPVYDTRHFPESLKRVGWPTRWQQWGQQSAAWTVKSETEGHSFSCSGDAAGDQWLRYRHAIPRYSEWKEINSGNLPDRIKNDFIGELIGDSNAYNEARSKVKFYRNGRRIEAEDNNFDRVGVHWAGDLSFEFDVEIKSNQGTLSLDLVEGGAHFTCKIDIASGAATLDVSDSEIRFVDSNGTRVGTPQSSVKINGQGKYNIRFANADDQIYLWVNNKPADFGIVGYKRDSELRPKYSLADPGDAEPMGIGSTGVAMDISRIQVMRDIYYTSDQSGDENNRDISFEYDDNKLDLLIFDNNLTQYQMRVPVDPQNQGPQSRFRVTSLGNQLVLDVFRDPSQWDGELMTGILDARKRNQNDVFELKKFPDQPSRDQYLPMGDNSPRSSDARVWGSNHFVERSFLLGRAMYIYWPHVKPKPVPFTPNFERMRLIR